MLPAKCAFRPVLRCFVKPLDNTVCLQIVRCGVEACSTKVYEGMTKIRCELMFPIRSDRRPCTKARDPASPESRRAGLSSSINHWNGLGPSGVSVNASRQVSVTLRWQQLGAGRSSVGLKHVIELSNADSHGKYRSIGQCLASYWARHTVPIPCNERS